MKQQLSENAKISPFLVYYLIISMQIGIGILSYQRTIAKDAGYDAWISVLAAGLTVHLLLWMMYKINESVDGDLHKVNEFVFGRIFSKIVNSFFIGYFSLYAITVLRSFLEVIQVWMFQDLNIFWYSFAFMILCIYIIYGGFRTVTGIALFGTLLPSYLIFIFAYTFPFSDFRNLFPLFDHPINELGKAYFNMTLTYTGYETLLFIYPFLKDPKKSKKWAHLSVLTTTIVYTFLAFITFAYYSEKQLQETIWPTLNIWKIVEMPFVERFEYVGIANWNLIILPNVCISLWIASRLIKQSFHIRQRSGVIIVSLVCLMVSTFIETRGQIEFLGDLFGKLSFIINFLFVPCLFLTIVIMKKVKKSG